METELTALNAAALDRELDWFFEVLETRLKLYFGHDCDYEYVEQHSPPDLVGNDAYFARIVRDNRLNFGERIVLALALVPHVRPHLLDALFLKNQLYDRGFSEFGGLKGKRHSGFIPTGETAIFILAGNDLAKRFAYTQLFAPDHFFHVQNVVKLDGEEGHEPMLSAPLVLSKEFLNYFTLGTPYKPDFGMNFPAQRISTRLDWEDLVLSPYVRNQVDEILSWLDFRETIMEKWGLKRKLKPGYRSLFYGPPGTGKTLTASLLGKSTRRDVYRIDLSKVVSKFIGETEKNLANVFDQAAHKEWILFFDEGDALFGKRGQTKDANDRYANQEIAYLLQRIEDFPGVIVLASNQKSNIDEAFFRRFQSVIEFPMPGPEERLRLWELAFADSCELEEGLDLGRISAQYEVTGGSIINVLRFCAIAAMRRGERVVRGGDIELGIRREFRKEGKIL